MILTCITLITGACLCAFFESIGIHNLYYLVIAINIIAVIIDINYLRIDNSIKKAMLFGFFFRLLLLIWEINFQHIFMFPDYPDSNLYMICANNVYNGLSEGRGGIYAKFIGRVIYPLFGSNPTIAKYINIIFAISTIYIVILTLKRINISSRSTILVSVLISLLPYYAMDNVLLIRESIIQFLIMMSLYMFIKWFMEDGNRYLILSIIISLIGASFHSGAIAATISYTVCWVLYDRNNQTFNIKLSTVFPVVVAVFLFFAINNSFGNELFGKFSNIENVDDVLNAANVRNDGGAGYNIGINTGNSSFDLLINTPLRMLYFVLSPVPWGWRNIKDVISFFFSAAIYGYIYCLSIRCFKYKTLKNRNILIVCFILSIASALVFAWGVSNSGAAMRHRDKFVGPYMILLGICANEIYAKNEKILNIK